MLVLAGCPADLDDPEQFPAVPPCRGDIDAEQFLINRCGGAACHGAGETPAGGLDLSSEGVAHRLVGVPSHECRGLLRIDPSDPDQSFFLGKLVGPPAGCGDRMPIVGFLDQRELGCMRAWVHEVAASTPVMDAGFMDAGRMDAAQMDAGSGDAEVSGDASPSDAAVDAAALDAAMDADVEDAGSPDGGAQDAGSGDSGVGDAGADDAGTDDAGATIAPRHGESR